MKFLQLFGVMSVLIAHSSACASSSGFSADLGDPGFMLKQQLTPLQAGTFDVRTGARLFP